MRLARKRPAAWLAVAVVVLCAALAAVVIVRLQGSREPTTVTVMTRNIYLGGDITRPIRAAVGRTGGDALLALGHANHELREIVDRTDFRVRAGLLADEIADTQPDLIGLQEVAMWRSGPFELDHLGQPNATVVDYDFLQLLQAALQDRGVGYDVVQVQQESDVEAPAFTGDPLTGSAGSAEDVRLTLSDVILRRTSSPVEISAHGGGQYRQRIQLTLGGGSYAFVRGFAWADVTSGAADSGSSPLIWSRRAPTWPSPRRGSWSAVRGAVRSADGHRLRLQLRSRRRHHPPGRHGRPVEHLRPAHRAELPR